MALQTRGSIILDKAQRRLASLKSIDDNLDLGHGLTVAAYIQLIEKTRTTLEAHNTLVSNIDESRRGLTAIEQTLSEMSVRMLSGVATKYGKSSNEYRKAGGSSRKRSKATPLNLPSTLPQVPSPNSLLASNGSTIEKPVLN